MCNNGLIFQNAYPAQGSEEECRNIIQKGGWQKTIGAFYRCDLPVRCIADFACASQSRYLYHRVKRCRLHGATLPVFAV